MTIDELKIPQRMSDYRIRAPSNFQFTFSTSRCSLISMNFMADVNVEASNETTSITNLLNELLTLVEKKDENSTESVDDCYGAKKRSALLNGSCNEEEGSHHHKRSKRQTTLDEHFFGAVPTAQVKRSSLLSSTASPIKTTFAITTSVLSKEEVKEMEERKKNRRQPSQIITENATYAAAAQQQRDMSRLSSNRLNLSASRPSALPITSMTERNEVKGKALVASLISDFCADDEDGRNSPQTASAASTSTYAAAAKQQRDMSRLPAAVANSTQQRTRRCIRTVSMPFASDNQCASFDNTNDNHHKSPRWPIIESALQSLVDADAPRSADIERVIASYNRDHAHLLRFEGLHRFFAKCLDAATADHYLHTVVRAMARLALRITQLCDQPISLLLQSSNSSVSISREQAACLLANAFFCTFPFRYSSHASLPLINFNRLFANSTICGMHKMRCIMHYFDRVTQSMPTGMLTYQRRFRAVGPDWCASRRSLADVHLSSTGTIEDDGIGMLQVDFANEYVGGGVLSYGCVQEEIRFVICPELLIACLLAEQMNDHECVVIVGVERFSNYRGYSDSFRWLSDHRDTVARDSSGHLATEIVAIDARPFSNHAQQFTPQAIMRELHKAYVGFYAANDDVKPIATGNWGCGVFGGDKELKALLQLLAASENRRPLHYWTFGDAQFATRFEHVYATLNNAKYTVGQLMKLINQFADELGTAMKRTSLFAFIESRLTAASSKM